MLFGDWLDPTGEAVKLAAKVQSGTFNEGFVSTTDANPHAVAIAAVHTRQDIALLCSMAAAQHQQLVNISRGVWVLAALGLWIVFDSPVRHTFGL